MSDQLARSLDYGTVMERTRDAVLLVEKASGRIVEANPRAADLFAEDREQLRGRHVAELRPPGDRSEVRRMFEDGDPPDEFGMVSRYQTRDGRRFLGELSAARVTVEGDDYLHGTLRDVTDRVGRARRYRSVVEASAAGMLVVGSDGRVVEANPAAAGMLGYEQARHLRGTPAADLYLDVSQRDELVHRLARRGRVRNFEVRLRHRDGSAVSVLMNVARDTDPVSGSVVDLETWVDITDRRRLQEELERQAGHDALTGLANRRALYDRARQILSICRRQELLGALLYIDIVGFKAVNEQLGHRGGDAVLREVAERLRRTVRDSDLVARIGGDEFVVVATLLGEEEDATQAGRRILMAFDDPIRVEEHEIHLHAAAGIAVFPHHGADLETLLDRADQALWGPERTKAPGMRVYDPRRSRQASGGLHLHEDLKRALQREREFTLRYQPVVAADTSERVGVEALVRWRHPELGMLGAGEFIPVAEASGLVGQLDRWVLVEAAEQVARWSDGEGPPWVAVNLSVQTLADPELPRFLREELLGREDRDPTRLVVEITEHVAMRQDEVTDHNLDVLREEVGLSLSIDDFGTGYSSLLYLRRLPADYLKVDMTFVRGLGRSTRDEKVVRAIIALGEEFDMRVIGEGVETEAQGRWLREAGCHHLQGFHYGRPVPGDEL